MSIKNFIPEIWSDNILRALDEQHVAVALANREYEGEISGAGDTVKVSQIGDITVSNYESGTDISFQDLDDSQKTLLIDQQKYFAFKVDDVDAAQANQNLIPEASRKSAVALSGVSDTFLLNKYADAGLSQNTDASPATVTSTNVDDEVLAVGEKMNENNVPVNAPRFMVIPPWFHTKLVQAGLTTKTVNDALFANGFIDQVLGFKMYMSNNVSIGTPATGANTRIICGVEGETFAFAEQIVKVEALRPEKAFEDAVKGLHVYGGKLWRPDMTCTLYVSKG